jgi:hypothetical protein
MNPLLRVVPCSLVGTAPERGAGLSAPAGVGLTAHAASVCLLGEQMAKAVVARRVAALARKVAVRPNSGHEYALVHVRVTGG